MADTDAKDFMIVDDKRLGIVNRYEKRLYVIETDPQEGWRHFAAGNAVWTVWLEDVDAEFYRYLTPLQVQAFYLGSHIACPGLILGAEFSDNDRGLLRLRFVEIARESMPTTEGV